MIWRLVLVSATVLIISVSAYPSLPRKYTATAEILIRHTNQEGRTTWDQSVQDAVDDNAIQTKVDMLRSESLQRAVAERNDLLADPEFNRELRPSWLRHTVKGASWLTPWLPEEPHADMQVRAALLKHLVAKRSKSYLMTIGYESADPIKAAALANSLVNEFRDDQIRRQAASQSDLLSAMRNRINELEALYHEKEQKEQDFVESSGLAHQGEKEAIDRQLVAISAALAEARRRTIEATSRAELLASQRADGIDNTTEALASPLLQSLRQRYVELSTGVGSAGLLPHGAPQPALGSLRDAIGAEAARLVKSAQNEASVAQKNEVMLRAEIIRLDLKLVDWQRNERHRVDLHRAVVSALDALHEANQRYDQQSGRGDVLESDVEIVSLAAVPDRPSFPDPFLYMLGTLALVGVCCGLMALLPKLRLGHAGR